MQQLLLIDMAETASNGQIHAGKYLDTTSHHSTKVLVTKHSGLKPQNM